MITVGLLYGGVLPPPPGGAEIHNHGEIMHTLNTLAQIGLAVLVLAAFVLGVFVGRISK